VYQDALCHPRIIPCDTTDSAFFAYPVRLSQIQVEDFLDFCQTQGHSFKRISYPDISPVFGEHTRFPNAQIVEEEFIGMPLDEDQPLSNFWDYASDFVHLLEAYLKETRKPYDATGRLEMRLGS
jgi:hypothetical protein